jgi:opacity protein-like surface antigen
LQNQLEPRFVMNAPRKDRLMKLRTIALAAVLLLCAPLTAATQRLPDLPLSLEVRVGAGIPIGDFANQEPGIEAEPGSAFGVSAAFHLNSVLAVYGGYSSTQFGCPRCESRGLDDSVVDSGFEFGAEAALPLRLAGFRPWIRAGGLYHELTFSGRGDQLSSDRSAGFEVGGGVAFAVLPVLWITPGIRYRTYSAELDLGGSFDQTVDVSSIALDVGLSLRF